MNNIFYKSEDESLVIELVFITKRRLKYSHLGKSWPIHTQCLLFSNGLLNHFETIVKHEKDKDNPIYANRLVAEKCIKTIGNKWLRGEIRTLLNINLEKLKNPCNDITIPEGTEKRMNIIGQNGNEGTHYNEVAKNN